MSPLEPASHSSQSLMLETLAVVLVIVVAGTDVAVEVAGCQPVGALSRPFASSEFPCFPKGSDVCCFLAQGNLQLVAQRNFPPIAVHPFVQLGFAVCATKVRHQEYLLHLLPRMDAASLHVLGPSLFVPYPDHLHL